MDRWSDRQTINRLLCRTAALPLKRTVSQLLCSSVFLPLNRSISHSLNRSIVLSLNHSIPRSLNHSIAQPSNIQSMGQSASGWIPFSFYAKRHIHATTPVGTNPLARKKKKKKLRLNRLFFLAAHAIASSFLSRHTNTTILCRRWATYKYACRCICLQTGHFRFVANFVGSVGRNTLNTKRML